MEFDTNSQKQGNGADVTASSVDGERVELRRVACHLTESLFKRILRKIFPDERRNDRQMQPPLVGYLGTMHSSRAYSLGDISLTGFCLLTDERWEQGTEMPITLLRTNLPEGREPETFTVQATVVRYGADGVGFSIVLCEGESQAAYGSPLRVRWITRSEMETFLNRLKEDPAGEASAPERSKENNRATVAGQGLKAAFEAGQ